MRACIRCGKVRFWWRFTTEFMGDYTAVSDVCKPCTKALGTNAAFAYQADVEKMRDGQCDICGDRAVAVSSFGDSKRYRRCAEHCFTKPGEEQGK